MIPEAVVKELKAKGKRTILVQLPEGLKPKARAIAAELRRNGFNPVIAGDPCFGACDLRFLKGATTLHVGHSKMIGGSAVYWEYGYDCALAEAARRALPFLGRRVGLFTTAQHLGHIEEAKAALEAAGKKVAAAKGRFTPNYQLLGCDVDGAVKLKNRVDTFLFIGTGQFHPIGIAYYTRKPVVAVDPFTLDIQELSWGQWERERALRQTKASGANSFGIVVSSKPGQERWELAKTLDKRLRAAGKETLLIYLDLVTPDTLLPYDVGAFVITACPRIVVDDWRNYKKAVLLPDEL